jgi:hypothetical protein
VGNFLDRISLAVRCLFTVLFAGRLPDGIPRAFLEPAGLTPRSADGPAEPDHPCSDEQTDRAVQLLALLQRDGRLVDFLFEEIAGFPDDQVGAAVREVHASCREVLRRYVTVEPVMPGEEGRPAVVDAGFDPGAVKLVGMVSGQPPFRGVLRHRGWRVARVQLPALAEGAGRLVIAPAEVEIG